MLVDVVCVDEVVGVLGSQCSAREGHSGHFRPGWGCPTFPDVRTARASRSPRSESRPPPRRFCRGAVGASSLDSASLRVTRTWGCLSTEVRGRPTRRPISTVVWGKSGEQAGEDDTANPWRGVPGDPDDQLGAGLGEADAAGTTDQIPFGVPGQGGSAAPTPARDGKTSAAYATSCPSTGGGGGQPDPAPCVGIVNCPQRGPQKGYRRPGGSRLARGRGAFSVPGAGLAPTRRAVQALTHSCHRRRLRLVV